MLRSAQLWQLNQDPLTDLANLSMVHLFPNVLDIGSKIDMQGLRGVDFPALRIPTEPELLLLYSQINRTFAHSELLRWSGFYLSFLLFKNVVIAHGVKERIIKQVSSSSNDTVEGGVGGMVENVLEMCEKMLRERPPIVNNGKL